MKILDSKRVVENKWVLAPLFLFALFIVGSACYGVFYNYHTIPLMDHWETLDLYEKYLTGNLGLRNFWEQHNEHRLLFPRILFLLDYLLDHGTGYLLISLILLLQGLHASLLGRSLWKNKTLSKSDRLFFLFTVFALCFWLIQRENFIWSFQVQWILNGFFASLAAFLVCKIDDGEEAPSNWKNVLLAALCCLVATYSLANGIFMCVVLLAVMWKSGLSRGLVFFWIAFGLALAGTYLIDYRSPPHHSSLREALHLRTLRYLLVYLGNPFSKFSILVGTLFGILSLALFSFFAWRFMLMRGRPSFFQKFGFSQITYLVFTAVITAIGRNNFGVIQATAGRYCTPVLIFWFFLLVLVYMSVEPGGKTVWRLRLGVLLFLALVVLPFQLRALSHMKIEYSKYDEASLGLIAGVEDTSMLYSNLYPNDSLIWERNGFLQDHRLSVYREPWTLTLGRSLFKEYDVDSNSVLRGESKEVRTLDSPPHSGYFVKGTIHIPEENRMPQVVLFTSQDTIIGYAKTTKRPCQGCFSGYVGGLEHKSFGMYGLETENPGRVLKISSLSGI